jgi:uncharacterized repeat protein (TIGR03803 family)
MKISSGLRIASVLLSAGLLAPVAGNAAQGTQYAVLHKFQDARGYDGSDPYGVLLVPGGTMFGVTALGGRNGDGVIYRIGPDGTELVLHDFSSDIDGKEPLGPLVLGSDGLLYGTTCYSGPAGGGTAFRIAQDGSGFTVLHAFGASQGVIHGPLSGLVEASDGNFYGTSAGGTDENGTVYSMSPDGTVTLVHEFQNDMALGTLPSPTAPLIQATDGALYGVTVYGGRAQGGIAYRLSLDGSFTTLHSFEGADGIGPTEPLVQGADGAFYGTTPGGGGAAHEGTAFRLAADGGFKVLHQFGQSAGDPATPASGLSVGLDGNFYGTTLGGEDGYATIFKMSPKGEVHVVHVFVRLVGGHQPYVPRLAVGPDGSLYGTTTQGGEQDKSWPSGAGVVYQLAR